MVNVIISSRTTVEFQINLKSLWKNVKTWVCTTIFWNYLSKDSISLSSFSSLSSSVSWWPILSIFFFSSSWERWQNFNLRRKMKQLIFDLSSWICCSERKKIKKTKKIKRSKERRKVEWGSGKFWVITVYDRYLIWYSGFLYTTYLPW